MGKVLDTTEKQSSAIQVKHPWRRRMIVGAAVTAVIATAAIIVAASVYAPDIAEAIVSVLTLLTAVCALYLLDRRMKATEQQTRVMTEQTKNMTKQTENTTKQTENTTKQTANAAKQIAESRFAKAFEQIGDKSVAIQLGGLNLLDIIAKEGEEEYQRVWGYLAGFLRYPPPLSSSENGGPVELRPGVAEIAKMLQQAHDRYPDHNAQLLNLSGVHLERADLSGVHLERADLSGAYFEGVNLSEAQIGWARLFGAHLEWADLRWTNLKGARLFGAHLEGANLYKANLQWTNLQAAFFDKVSRLDKAIFDDTNVSNCDFSQVKDLSAEQLRGMIWIEGQQAPRLPDNLSQQTIRCITKKEWREIQKGYNRQNNQ